MRPGFSMPRTALAGVEAVLAETDHAFPRHWHEQYGIGLVHRGAQRSLSGRGMVEAGAGDVITVNPGEVHDGMPIGDGGRAWTMLYFDPVLIVEAAGDIGEGRPGTCELPAPVVRDAATASCYRRLFAAATAGAGPAGDPCEEPLLHLLARLVRERGDRGAGSAPPPVGRAMQRIDDAPADAVTLADLAAESGLSRFQVLRGFVSATGLTPHAYLLQRRIDLARRLIAAGTRLADAAAASGFADQAHMTRVFVRRYGVSPGLYARAVAR